MEPELTVDGPEGGRRRTRSWSARGGIASVAVAAVTAFLLAGCGAHPVSAPRQGQTVASAEAALRAVPGVEKASIHVDSHVSGLSYFWDIETEVTVKPGATIPDPVKLLDYVLAVSWSENRAKPTDETIGVTITTTPQIDVQAVATEAGFTDFTEPSTPGPTDGPTAPHTDAPEPTPTTPVQNAVALTDAPPPPTDVPTPEASTPTDDADLLPYGTFLTRDVTAKFGTWPAAPPARPAGLVVG